MKHKLTVLACVGLALLLSTGFAFAQETITVAGGNLDRCKADQLVNVYITNNTPLMGIGLPLQISGGATITNVTLGPALSGLGWVTANSFLLNPGSSGIVNAVDGTCLPPGVMQHIFTLKVTTPSSCTGNIEIDKLDFFPPAGAYMLVDCNALIIAPAAFSKGTLALVNKAPICGTNADVPVAWNGSIVDKVLNASDPDACDNPLTNFALQNAGGLNASAQVVNGKFSYTASCLDKGEHTVTFRATDQCDGYVDCTFKVTVTNTAPICGSNPAENVYFMTGVVNKTLHASDPNGDPLTYTMVTVGKGTVTSAGVYNWATVCTNVGTHTITFRASDGCDFVECSFEVTVYQNAPVCGPTPTPQVVDWCSSLSVPLSATDDDCLQPSLSWSAAAVPTPTNPIVINPLLGDNVTLVFDPVCAEFGTTFAVTVTVFDGEKSCEIVFPITVTNDAPVIHCPAPVYVVAGDLAHALVTATDSDCDNVFTFGPLTFTKIDGPMPPGPVNPPTLTPDGQFSWQSTNDTLDLGTWLATVVVTDGCGLKDTCSFEVHAIGFSLCIRGELGDSLNIHILSGMTATAYVDLRDGGYPLGGINLLVCYDQSGLSFIKATKMGNLAKWEYFTWRYSSQSNCQGGCPTGYIRIVAIADLDNGPNHPTYPDDFVLDGRIVALDFLVTADRNYIGQCLNVGFCSLACGDNALSSFEGDTLFVPFHYPFSCDTSKKQYRNVVWLCDGQICIDEPKDDRGDMNLNGVANEIGDAVLFTNYFIYGDDVFSDVCPPGQSCYKDIQILASDVNDDGIVLTVADLVYMIRIITGDAQPFPPGGNPKLSPYVNSATASFRVENNTLRISTASPVDLGGAAFVFRYNGMGLGEPVLSAAASGLKVSSSTKNGELRVVVYPDLAKLASVSAGTNEIVSIPTAGEGTIELVDVQMSDTYGALLSSNAAKVGPPKEYALLQNYPNPFNAGTVVGFNLTKASDWSLTVYNIAGQVVRTFAGNNDAGTVRVAWDGKDVSGNHVASGVYFYRLKADTFTATKKMTLLK